jgi:hypothetical protein
MMMSRLASMSFKMPNAVAYEGSEHATTPADILAHQITALKILGKFVEQDGKTDTVIFADASVLEKAIMAIAGNDEVAQGMLRGKTWVPGEISTIAYYKGEIFAFKSHPPFS